MVNLNEKWGIVIKLNKKWRIVVNLSKKWRMAKKNNGQESEL